MVRNIIEIYNKGVQGSAVASDSSVAASLAQENGNEGKQTAKSQKQASEGIKKLTSKNWMKSLGKTIGVSFGVSTFLKQSQVFTSMFGTLFQIVGAIADILLAPVVKYLAPKIGDLAQKAIEFARFGGKKVEAVISFLFSETPAILKTIKFIDRLLSGFPPVVIGRRIQDLIRWLFEGGIIDQMEAMLKRLWNNIKGFFQNLIDLIKEKLGLKNIAGGAIAGIGGVGSKIGNAIGGFLKNTISEAVSGTPAEAASLVRPRLNINRTNLPLPTGTFGEGAMGEMINERMTLAGFGVSKGQSEHINQMIMGDQQLREHTKTDHDTMMAARRNSPRGFGGSGLADM